MNYAFLVVQYYLLCPLLDRVKQKYAVVELRFCDVQAANTSLASFATNIFFKKIHWFPFLKPNNLHTILTIAYLHSISKFA